MSNFELEWQSLYFSTSPIIANRELSIHQTDDDELVVWSLADGKTLASVPKAQLQQINVGDNQALTTAAFRDALKTAGVCLCEPDNVYKAPAVFSPSAAGCDNVTCRALTGEDDALFRAFCADISEEDLDNAWVELDHWAVYGLFIDGQLAVACSLYPFGDSKLADLGVVTTPTQRRKGLANKLVSYADEQMRERGYLLQYRSQLDNHASIALAESLGFELVGQYEGQKTED